MLTDLARWWRWRRRVRAAQAWRDAERAEYRRAIDRITAVTPSGAGTIRRPRS
jgi:hypothetical protein